MTQKSMIHSSSESTTLPLVIIMVGVHSLVIASVASGYGLGGQVKDEPGKDCDEMDDGTCVYDKSESYKRTSSF